ncbi:PqiC family protein [Ralstonia soli]|uniref:ABC-type transport auxiliary lipoprotein family protein n=1 Tax=Ralstonia soli TaxID=2953896 RepID=A0ABT1AT45_9RALS|nr:ABC-type transport auxiliary lipoprotein family protein [Ralstonia soli]MCO5401565.1 ABC-type transport auxiliary lipoprotein family protein [Ralstonia soli]
MMPMQLTMLSSSLRLAGACAAVAMVAACASPEPTLHTLSVRPEAADMGRFQRAFRLSGVRVPDRLDKPQIVLRTSDSEVVALEQQRWAAPFGSELRDALSADLASTLSAVDVGGGAAPAGVPLYRIGAEMRSYDARPGLGVTALVTWRVSRDLATQDATPAALTCQTTLTQPAGADANAGVNAVVSSTQRLVQQWSQQIAQSVQGLESPSAVPAWCR